jgi:hypothetical protein
MKLDFHIKPFFFNFRDYVLQSFPAQAIVQLVEAILYTPEGRGFESR